MLYTDGFSTPPVLKFDFQPVVRNNEAVLCRLGAKLLVVVPEKRVVREVIHDENRLFVRQSFFYQPIFHQRVGAKAHVSVFPALGIERAGAIQRNEIETTELL